MQTKSKPKSKDKFSLELTTTQMCNFSCEYCFENDCKVPDDNKISRRINDVIKALKNLFDDEWYDDTFETTQLTFWGGEPALNIEFINKIVSAFEDNERIGFYIYTNGSQMEKLLPILLRLKGQTIGVMPRFSVQISYDGNPVHDMRRLTKSGEPTSDQVIKAMDLLYQNDIPFALKSTLAHKDFKYLPLIWDDIKRLHDKYGVNYSVTVDYHNMEIYTYFDDLEKALIEVSSKEYKFYKEHTEFLSNIFSANKKFCSAGKRMMTVDIDGMLYVCHGACYSKYALELGGVRSIFDLDLIKSVKYNYNFFYETNRHVEECEQCVALTCLRCNVKKYEESSNSGYLDRWHDYACEDELCLYYKTAGRIGRALIELLREE